eukprot:5109990-Amphidinium_carterae.2
MKLNPQLLRKLIGECSKTVNQYNVVWTVLNSKNANSETRMFARYESRSGSAVTDVQNDAQKRR